MNSRTHRPRFPFFFLFTGLVLWSIANPLLAKPAIKDGFFLAYSSNAYTLPEPLFNLPSNDKDCGICHRDFDGGGPRNPYGLDVEVAVQGLKNNETAQMATEIWAIRNVDSDGDGHSTFTEVTDGAYGGIYDNTPTLPGLTAANVGSTSNVDLSDINGILVPTSGGPDTTPPVLAVTGPNGGETVTGNAAESITWTVSDADSGVAGVDIYLSLDGGTTFSPVAYLIGAAANSGSYSWFPSNRPTGQAIVWISAIDNAGNSATDESDAVFDIVAPPGGLVATTLRDFDMPGTQPLENRIQPLQDPQTCAGCHGGYDDDEEPHHNWQGSMMANASLDFMFEANMVIANQDAPDSGDLCLRCHNSRGWLDGRSTPTDGSQMLAADKKGVSCDLCHRMVDPYYDAGTDPAEDFDILAELGSVPAEFTSGNFVVDPQGRRRGPFDDADSAHAIVVSPFHRSSELCGTCHDVSNPVFVRPAGAVSGDEYAAAPLDSPPTELSSAVLMPVERTYSEWKHSAFNSAEGVLRPEFAGNKPDGYVASCQDCHMRDVSGYGADPAQYPAVPERENLPLHDMTGSSTWVPSVIAAEYPAEVNATAIADGIARAQYMLQNALRVAVHDEGSRMRVRLVNRSGHKLPTGYPEGRRMWINVKFFEGPTLVKESGAYDFGTGVLSPDPELKVYETKPGIGPALAASLGLDSGPSFHFVLNNKVYKDNRIPPEGFTNAGFDTFGGAPIGHAYVDGQYWDDTWYAIPANADRAEVRVYFQSVSKEFVEFLKSENTTNTLGDEVYALWNDNGKAPPELMVEDNWISGFVVTETEPVGGEVHVHFQSRVGETYWIEYADNLGSGGDGWQSFADNGSLTATGTSSTFVDDFTANTSGGPMADGRRFYRVRH